MKFQVLVCTGILLVALLPCHECRAFSSKSSNGAPEYHPFLLRMGEEYFLRLGNLHKSPLGGGSRVGDVSSSNFVRAAQQLEPQQWLGSMVDGGDSPPFSAQEEPTERGKRSEEPPISLDLTFHLLREVLEMARAEQIAQQAHSNRKLMDIIGK
uniref:Corticotropin-releasing hormone n=1 Tax=Lithobates sylvaticus TaxID=45438 RepID=D9IG63_LITSY|nr:corticotropin-releasing hormone [Lithobates sylvaticus]AEQ37345.1 corticotropin-releasing hormone [Lithobates sylvaticus]